MLRTLSQTFETPLGDTIDFRRFVEEISAHLLADARLSQDQGDPLLEVDMEQSIETGRIAQRIWQTLQKAIRERRKLSFDYHSPRHADGQAPITRWLPTGCAFMGSLVSVCL